MFTARINKNKISVTQNSIFEVYISSKFWKNFVQHLNFILGIVAHIFVFIKNAKYILNHYFPLK